MAFDHRLERKSQKNGLRAFVAVTPDVATNRRISIHYYGLAFISGGSLVLLQRFQS